MSNSKKIGIKLYNDKFLPVINENENKIKKVVLTTVRDNQEKTIIELYEGDSDNCINNEYLGKLVIPIKRSTIKGDPAIEVHLRLDQDGILYAKAWDIDSGEQSEIQIEHTLQKTILHETNDKAVFTGIDDTATRVEGMSDDYYLKKGNLLRNILLIIALLILLILLGIGIFFGIKYLRAKALEKKSTTIEKKLEVKKEPEIIDTTPDTEKEKVEEKKEITGIKKVEGSQHYIVWGDNLWNICKKYYNDPWYYPALAEANNIKIPRLIYAGTYITIPPKNTLTRWNIAE